jgi:hypothetical protein
MVRGSLTILVETILFMLDEGPTPPTMHSHNCFTTRIASASNPRPRPRRYKMVAYLVTDDGCAAAPSGEQNPKIFHCIHSLVCALR